MTSLLSNFFAAFLPPPPYDEEADPTILAFYPETIASESQFFVVGCVLGSGSLISSMEQSERPILVRTESACIVSHTAPQDGVVLAFGIPASIPTVVAHERFSLFQLLAQMLIGPVNQLTPEQATERYKAVFPILMGNYRSIYDPTMQSICRMPGFLQRPSTQRSLTVAGMGDLIKLLSLRGLLGLMVLCSGEIYYNSLPDMLSPLLPLLSALIPSPSLRQVYLPPALIRDLQKSTVERVLQETDIEDGDGMLDPGALAPIPSEDYTFPKLNDIPAPFGTSSGPVSLRQGGFGTLLTLKAGEVSLIALLDQSWMVTRENLDVLTPLTQILESMNSTYSGERLISLGSLITGGFNFPVPQSDDLHFLFNCNVISVLSKPPHRLTASDESGALQAESIGAWKTRRKRRTVDQDDLQKKLDSLRNNSPSAHDYKGYYRTTLGGCFDLSLSDSGLTGNAGTIEITGATAAARDLRASERYSLRLESPTGTANSPAFVASGRMGHYAEALFTN